MYLNCSEIITTCWGSGLCWSLFCRGMNGAQLAAAVTEGRHACRQFTVHFDTFLSRLCLPVSVRVSVCLVSVSVCLVWVSVWGVCLFVQCGCSVFPGGQLLLRVS